MLVFLLAFDVTDPVLINLINNNQFSIIIIIINFINYALFIEDFMNLFNFIC
jgi:hypothetical protein